MEKCSVPDVNPAAVKAFLLPETQMPRDISLIAILQKLYAGETGLYISSGDDGWEIELGDETHTAYATRKFTPDDIADCQSGSKPRAQSRGSPRSWAGASGQGSDTCAS